MWLNTLHLGNVIKELRSILTLESQCNNHRLLFGVTFCCNDNDLVSLRSLFDLFDLGVINKWYRRFSLSSRGELCIRILDVGVHTLCLGLLGLLV